MELLALIRLQLTREPRLPLKRARRLRALAPIQRYLKRWGSWAGALAAARAQLDGPVAQERTSLAGSPRRRVRFRQRARLLVDRLREERFWDYERRRRRREERDRTI